MKRRTLDPEQIKCALLFYSAPHQPVVTLRTATLKAYDYRESLTLCADYDLLSWPADRLPLVNLPEVLAVHQEGGHQTPKAKAGELPRQTMQVQAESLERMGMSFTKTDLSRHFQIPTKRGFGFEHDPDGEYLDWFADWAAFLLARAEDRRQYSVMMLRGLARALFRKQARRELRRGHVGAGLRHQLSGLPA